MMLIWSEVEADAKLRQGWHTNDLRERRVILEQEVREVMIVVVVRVVYKRANRVHLEIPHISALPWIYQPTKLDLSLAKLKYTRQVDQTRLC